MGYLLFKAHLFNKQTRQSDPKTTIEFISETDLVFGKIKKGEKLEFEYKLKNTGNYPLLIYDIIINCKCTGYHTSKKITLPNDSTTIKLFFDSKDKIGFQAVKAVIHSNTEPAYTEIAFFGEVISD